jgi:transcriptional regulator with XRE-family HTH domain
MKMAERIRERRLAMGLTQEDLASKLGLQKSAIAKYENGRVENIKRSVIARMSEVLLCNPAYLMGFSDDIELKQNSVSSSLSLQSLTFLESEFLRMFRKLNIEGQQKVQAYMEDLISLDKYTEPSPEVCESNFA